MSHPASACRQHVRACAVEYGRARLGDARAQLLRKRQALALGHHGQHLLHLLQAGRGHADAQAAAAQRLDHLPARWFFSSRVAGSAVYCMGSRTPAAAVRWAADKQT